MSSIIEGYNYDIFISYRQKDNKGDKWVSEFVEALKTELESTFKEEISVYFDINPSDYLLESYDVDASLKEKLNCLVFIPIISRTYCDPKSFAWEHEFKAFVEQASKDQFGLKVKLPNGNVANRVLPVRIHDLDKADIKECESILGGVLRGVEFIYKESGVDKPLAPGDDEQKNFNNTKYKIQIVKVAHAIKEIILGVKEEPILILNEKEQSKEIFTQDTEKGKKIEPKQPVKEGKRKLFLIPAIAALLIVVAILSYPKIVKHSTFEKLTSSGERITVAVMPFQNMTNDTSWNIWQDGIQANLITSLSSTGELKVRQTQTIKSLLQSKDLTNYSSITPSVAGSISQKLDADVFIFGNINQEGSTIRINAQILDSKTEDIIKSFQLDGTADMVLPLIDSLSDLVNKFLIITKLGKELSHEFQMLTSTDSPEAYRLLIYGDDAFFIKRDYLSAAKLYSRAAAIDSNFTIAIIKLSLVLDFLYQYDLSKKCIMRAYQKRDQMSLQEKLFVNFAYAILYETPYDEIKYLKQLLEYDDQMPFILESLSFGYDRLHQYDKEISGLEKALKIYEKWDSKPLWVYSYSNLGKAYHKTGQYNKERKLYKKAEQDFPDDPLLIRRQATLLLTEGDTIAANRYIRNFISLSKERSVSDASISNFMALIYEDAGVLDRAEKYYREALHIQPKNPSRLNTLAWFLIDKERNVKEGVELADKALNLSPDDYLIIDTKGWGLYKQGNYKEALDLLEKAWNLRSIYDYEIYLHLEAARKAVAGQKNN